MKNKERFFKVYANLPINLRREVIVVIDNEPISWQVAYLEISNETRLGERIVKKLVELDIV